MKTKAKLTKADLFYIEQKLNERTDAELAKDIGKPVALVREYAGKLRESGWTPPTAKAPEPTPPTKVEKAGWHGDRRIAVRDEAASTAADKAHKQRLENPKDRSKMKGVHVIDPTRPVF